MSGKINAAKGLKITGSVVVKKNGWIVGKGRNLVVTSGKNLLAEIVGASGVKPSHIAFGDGAAAVDEAQTALQGTEFERQAISSTSVVGNTVTYSATLGSGIVGTQTLREVGIFNAASGGTMLARFLTSEVTVDNTDQLDVTWSIAFGD